MMSCSLYNFYTEIQHLLTENVCFICFEAMKILMACIKKIL